MHQIVRRGACSAVLASLCLFSTGAIAAGPQVGHVVGGLRFIGEQRLPLKMPYRDTVVGGLSGIDYDPRTDTWVMQSDDRSKFNPARFYTARLSYDEQAFHAVEVSGVFFFKQADGSNYPGVTQATAANPDVPDIESIRFDPRDGTLWYTSEGDQKRNLDPYVRQAKADGSFLATMPLAPMFKMSKSGKSGPRNNLVFEGSSFAPDGNSLWVSVEAPMIQDGPLATTMAGGVNRITRFERDGKIMAQYAYPIDALQAAAGPGKEAVNGISEILAVDDQKVLVLERSGVEDKDGKWSNFVRLYEMDVAGATDISGIVALKGAQYVPAKKRLVLDLNLLKLPKLDNVEGLSWGPKLPNGNDSLILMSDDNFDETEVQQFLLFEVLPQ